MLRRSARLLHHPLPRYWSPRALATPATPSPPTPLLLELHRQIRFHGPLTIAEYMRHSLLHPTHGYYTTTATIGPRGDFTTSPQLSPIFAELLSVFLAHHIRPPYTLIELGPGTGSLLSAALPTLQTLRAAPTAVHLVERSPRLRRAQAAALSAIPSAPSISWSPTLAAALASADPALPRVLLAHEFLDALPVHVFHRPHPAAPWRERLVDLDPTASPDQPRLRFVLSPAPTPALALLPLFPPPQHATVAEVCPEAAALAQEMAAAVANPGGLALLVDYGDNGGGDTLRGYKTHKQVDVLSEPGQADMTADVDFRHLRRAVERADAEGVRFCGPVTQREFLLRMGAAARFRRVAQGVVERGERVGESDEVVDRRLERLQAEYDRLVGEGEMGVRFKVAAIVKGEGEMAGGF